MKKADERMSSLLSLQGSELRRYREERTNLKQREVSRMMGRSINWLSEIENGRNSIDAIDLCRLCALYGVDPNIIFQKLIAHMTK